MIANKFDLPLVTRENNARQTGEMLFADDEFSRRLRRAVKNLAAAVDLNYKIRFLIERRENIRKS